MTADARKIREQRNRLRQLTHAVTIALAALDAQMALPSSVDRGRSIAQICNYLNNEKTIARHYGPGEPLTKRKDAK